MNNNKANQKLTSIANKHLRKREDDGTQDLREENRMKYRQIRPSRKRPRSAIGSSRRSRGRRAQEARVS